MAFSQMKYCPKPDNTAQAFSFAILVIYISSRENKNQETVQWVVQQWTVPIYSLFDQAGNGFSQRK
jgi:hypothetical protein